MTSSRHHQVADSEVWLSVQDASAMLGVSPATLRRWSAAGEVEAFTTPGGHRRYARSTIQHLLPQPVSPETTVSALGESSERVTRIIGRHVRSACRSISWLDEADTDVRQLLAVQGRGMVEGLLGYVDLRGRRERETALRPALEAAAMHGQLAAWHQGDLGETVEVFHRFRSFFIDELAGMACRHGLDTQQATRIIARANDGIDRLIVALVEAHAAAADRTAASS